MAATPATMAAGAAADDGSAMRGEEADRGEEREPARADHE